MSMDSNSYQLKSSKPLHSLYKSSNQNGIEKGKKVTLNSLYINQYVTKAGLIKITFYFKGPHLRLEANTSSNYKLTNSHFQII